jgi:hypothetical protein
MQVETRTPKQTANERNLRGIITHPHTKCTENQICGEPAIAGRIRT